MVVAFGELRASLTGTTLGRGPSASGFGITSPGAGLPQALKNRVTGSAKAKSVSVDC